MKKNKKPKHNLSGKTNLSDAVTTSEKDNSNIYIYIYIALAVIGLISIISYLPVLHNGLLNWDDGFYIINNHLLKDLSWNGIKTIFRDISWDIYCPLTFLIHAVLFKIGGFNPALFHLTSLILHLLNTALVFWFIKMLCERWEIAAIAALLFGIHPMGVESVAWASAGTNIHYAAFFLGSLVAYLYYLQQWQKRYLFISLLLFILSSLSKAVAVVLPVILLLIDYYKGRKITINVLLEKVPFLMISLGTGILSFLLKNQTGNVGDLAVFTFPTRVVFASYGFITYIFKLLLPFNLSAFYPYPMNKSVPIHYYFYVLAFLGLAAYIIYSVRFSKKIIFGMGFFTITILLVLQLLPVGKAIMADRYSYIPSIGIFYLAGEGLVFLWNNNLKSRTFGIALLSVAAVLFSIKTYARCGVWKNDEILWSDVINRYQTIDEAYYNRGHAYLNEKRSADAIKDFNKAIELNPKYAEAYNSRGYIFMNERRNDEALNDFNKAIELKPDFEDAHINRSVFYTNKKKNDEALIHFNKAIEENPGDALAYENRGELYLSLKQYDEAMKDFNKAIELKADYAPAYLNRGIFLAMEKRFGEAIKDLSKAIELKPDYALAYYNRGIFEYQSGNKAAACMDLKKAAGLGYEPAAKALSQICK